jgi:hypothetical protein
MRIKNFEDSHYAIISILVLLSLSLVRMFPYVILFSNSLILCHFLKVRVQVPHEI